MFVLVGGCYNSEVSIIIIIKLLLCKEACDFSVIKKAWFFGVPKKIPTNNQPTARHHHVLHRPIGRRCDGEALRGLRKPKNGWRVWTVGFFVGASHSSKRESHLQNPVGFEKEITSFEIGHGVEELGS